MRGVRVTLGASAASNGRLVRMLSAYLLLGLTEFGSWMVILLVAFDQGGAVMVGAASVAMLVPALLLTPLVAAFGDQMPRGSALARTAAIVGLLTSLLAALLVVQAPLWLLLVGGAVQTVAVSLVGPLHYSALPFVARNPAELVAANGMSTFIQGAGLFLGFTAAGAVVAAADPAPAMFGCALLALMAAALTARLRIAATRQNPADGSAGAPAAAVRGLASRRGNGGALALLLLIFATSLLDGGNEPLMLTFNAEVLGRSDATAGLLAGGYGAGLAAGGLLNATFAGRRLAPWAVFGSVFMAAAFAAIGATDAVAPAFLLATAAGVGASIVLVTARTLLQRSTDNAVLARVFAVQEGLDLAGLTVGAILAPAAIEVLGPRWAFLPLALIVPAIIAVAHARIVALERSSGVRRRELQLLRRTPFLAALAPPSLEHLAQAATWTDHPPRTEVVRQGEAGDAYYLVGSGELSVTVDGVRRDHTLGPGDGFGEIALMFGSPRSATVTALSPCELLRVDAAHFLSALGADTDGTALAREVARRHLDDDGSQ